MNPLMYKATGYVMLAAIAAGFAMWLNRSWLEIATVYIGVFVGLTFSAGPPQKK